MNEPLITAFVVEFKVLVQSVNPIEDTERVRDMTRALEETAKEYGGTYAVKEVRWG